MDLKEKILKSNEIDLISIADELGWNTDDYISCNYKAMEELSKIVAIAFLKWTGENGYRLFGNWYHADDEDGSNPLSEKELYELFTQSKDYQELMDGK